MSNISLRAYLGSPRPALNAPTIQRLLRLRQAWLQPFDEVGA
jgi:hypothetical protein